MKNQINKTIFTQKINLGYGVLLGLFCLLTTSCGSYQQVNYSTRPLHVLELQKSVIDTQYRPYSAQWRR